MLNKVLGIHHLTAISGAAHTNYDFYTRVLGLKLVKKTVNFDDPGTYHLYYGDATGSPGSLLTFFPYEGRPGRPGPGQVTGTVYAVAPGHLQEWTSRLQEEGVQVQSVLSFGRKGLRFNDPHGMGLEIIESPEATGGTLQRFAGAVISLRQTGPTRELLEWLGYQVIDEEGTSLRLGVPGSDDFLELRQAPSGGAPGGPGTVHHIALRLAHDAAQQEWHAALTERGLRVSPITDRNYFNSIYFRGPEGVLYELATDPPGMLIDEDLESLGTTLRLPPQYEKLRGVLEDQLAPLEVPFKTYERPGKTPMLVGLHGTGGDEHDLIPLLEQLDPQAHLLTLRGQVSEGGHHRFFRRLREGVFDQEDLRQRGRVLGRFLSQRPEPKVVVGYSNGANMAAYTMMSFPQAVSKAVLIRPMLGWEPALEGDLSGSSVLVLIGRRDSVVSPDSGRALAQALLDKGAQVEVHEVDGGHELTAEDVRIIQGWLRTSPILAERR